MAKQYSNCAGLKLSHAADPFKVKTPKDPRKNAKKKSKRVVEEDDAIYAADVLSSEDDFDDVLAKYAYGGQTTPARRPSNAVSAAGSDDEAGDGDGLSADDASISGTDEDADDDPEDVDDTDFVG